MNIIVGRTLKTVCSRSESMPGSRAVAWARASFVASGSTALPQLEQKRTLGVTYAPHLEHVMNLSSLSRENDVLVLSLLIIPKASEIQNETGRRKGSLAAEGRSEGEKGRRG